MRDSWGLGQRVGTGYQPPEPDDLAKAGLLDRRGEPDDIAGGTSRWGAPDAVHAHSIIGTQD